MKEHLTKIMIACAALAGVLIYVQARAYIGYYIAVLAIPYGIYGLFTPYKSARAYAKKGCAVTYSRQLGALFLSLGVLGFLLGQLYDILPEHKLLLVALLVYVALFFFVISVLNDRYMKKPNEIDLSDNGNESQKNRSKKKRKKK